MLRARLWSRSRSVGRSVSRQAWTSPRRRSRVAPLRGEGTAAIAVRKRRRIVLLRLRRARPDPACRPVRAPPQRARSGRTTGAAASRSGACQSSGSAICRCSLRAACAFVMGSYISVPQPPVYLLGARRTDGVRRNRARRQPAAADDAGVRGRRPAGPHRRPGRARRHAVRLRYRDAVTLLPPIGQQFSVNSVAVGRGSLFVALFDQQFNRPTWIEVDLRTGEVLSQSGRMRPRSSRLRAGELDHRAKAEPSRRTARTRTSHARHRGPGTLLNGAEVAGLGETFCNPAYRLGSIGLGDGQLQLVFRASALPLGTYDGFAVVEVDTEVSGTVPFVFSVSSWTRPPRRRSPRRRRSRSALRRQPLARAMRRPSRCPRRCAPR